MNVINVSSYYPPHLGGGDNVVRALSEGLAKKGHKVVVFTSNIGVKNNELKSTENLKINYLNSIEFGHSSIIFTLFFRLLFIPKNSILYVSVGHAYVPEIVYLVSKIRRIPYVAHFHIDVDPSGKFGFLLKYYKKYFLSMVLRNANKVICLTNDQKKFLKIEYGIDIAKIDVIQNGVSDEYFVNNKRKLHKPVELLFVGRLVKQKNIRLIIESIKYIKNSIRLNIVGDGEEKDNLEKLVKSIKLNNVIFHGKKESSELVNYYRNSDIFLMSSLNEGMSLSMLEAMAAGLPIVSNKVSSIDNSLKCGEFIENLTSLNLARKIDKLIDSTYEYDEISNNCRTIAQRYRWGNSINKLEALYNELLLK